MGIEYRNFIGNGLRGDGVDDTATVPREPWNVSDQITVVLVFKYVLSSLGKYNIVANTNINAIYFAIRTNIGANRIGYYRSSLNTSVINAEFQSADNTLIEGNYYMAVITKPNTTNNDFRCYLNGAFIGEITDGNTDSYLSTSDVSLFHGNSPQQIHHYSRYSRAFTDQEVANLYDTWDFPKSDRLEFISFNQDRGGIISSLGNTVTMNGWSNTIDYGEGAWIDEFGNIAI